MRDPTNDIALDDDADTERSEAQTWLDAISAGLEFRQIFGLEDTWTDLEAKFFSVSAAKDVGPNLIASKGDTIVSALAVPSVEVQVEPRFEKVVDAAPVVQSFANAMLNGLHVDDEMEEGLTDAFLFGVGFLKIGFDSEWGYDPTKSIPGVGGTLTQYDKEGTLLESGRAKSGLPWVRCVSPRDVVVPWGTKNLFDAPWIAHHVVRGVAEVRADVKYTLTERQKVRGTLSMRDVTLGYSTVKHNTEESETTLSESEEGDEKTFVRLYEIMDKLKRRVIVIAPQEKGAPLVLRDEVNELQIDNVLPWIDITMSLRTRALWVTPPAFYAAAHQNELDDVHLQAAEQRRASLLKLLIRKDALDSAGKAALSAGKVGLFVETADPGTPLNEVVQYIGANQSINVLLHQESEVLQASAREALGISRNLSGEFSGQSRTTALETQAVHQGSEIRMGRKQKSLRRSYRNLLSILLAIAAKHLEVPVTVRVCGLDGAVRWEAIKAELLDSSRFTFKITFTTEHFEDAASRQQSALNLYASLMSDPRVDQNALLQQLVAAVASPNVKTQGDTNAPLRVQMPGPGMPGGAGRVPQN
jgi:hypothetical protein